MTKLRAVAILLAFAMVLGVFGFRLYSKQILEADPEANTGSTYTTVSRVSAARGEILDRNGVVLVGNRASYNLVFNSYVLYNADNPNEALRQLVSLCDQLDIQYIDHFPVSYEKPYEYTLSDLNSTWQGYFRAFLNYREWDSDMSAAQLVKLLRDGYHLPDSWTDEEVRRVIGLRYELELRTDLTNLSAYTFIQDVDSEDLSAILELNTPGLSVQTSTAREYSEYADYLSHILGYVGAMSPEQYAVYKEQGYAMDAVVGQSGFELAFEPYLHGTDGTLYTTVDSGGDVVREYYSVPPEAGSNVETTIDINIQIAVADALEEVILDLRENGLNDDGDGMDAEGGAVVVIKVDTGEILACASYPTYSLETYFENFNEIAQQPYSPFVNRALQSTYAPGSVYKMVPTIAAANTGLITRFTTVEDKGVYDKYENYKPQCLIYTNSKRTHGSINVEQALAVSCNYFFYWIGDNIKWERVDGVAKSLGLGESTGVELAEKTGRRANEETKAEIYANDPNNSGWYAADALGAAIGQSENRFTPLQLAVYTAALANGGTRYRATFMKRVVSSDYESLILSSQPEILSRCDISEEAYYCYTNGMRQAVTNGTVSLLKNYDIAVCAKTGTAQHGSGGSDNGSFVCYAPANNPEIAIAVFVEKGAQGGNLAKVAKAAMDVYFSQSVSEQEIPTENGVS